MIFRLGLLFVPIALLASSPAVAQSPPLPSGCISVVRTDAEIEMISAAYEAKSATRTRELPTWEEAQAYIEAREQREELIQAERLQASEGVAEKYAITPDELESVQDYARYDFEELNPVLRRDRETGGKTGMKRDYLRIARVDSGLRKYPESPGISYRGMMVKNHRLGDFPIRVGGFLKDPAFFSSDEAIEIAVKFSDEVYETTTSYVFEIHGKTGRRISVFSDNVSETEVLFLPNTEFRVRSIRPSNGRILVVIDELVATAAR